MLIPSETVIVPKMTDFPPAPSAPAPASCASLSMCMLQGVAMLHVDAIPTTGLAKSASVKPTARSMERLNARSGPSVRIEDCWRSGSLRALMDEHTDHQRRMGRASGVFMVAWPVRQAIHFVFDPPHGVQLEKGAQSAAPFLEPAAGSQGHPGGL